MKSGFAARERRLDVVEQLAVGLADRVLGDLRRLRARERRRVARLPDLALARIGTAALDDERLERRARGEDLLRLDDGRRSR